MTDVAIAHDQFRTMGGAEKVACDIAREFNAPVYAMRVDETVPPDDVDVIELSDTKGRWIMRRHFLIQDAYQMVAWQHVPELHSYDTIIETKTNPYWYVPKDTQTIIRYTHSTPRGLYDQFHRRGGHWLTDGLKTVQRMLYQQVVSYANHWIANSDIVKRRIQMYFNIPEREISVVYPGVDVASASPTREETGDYLFAIGRLAVNKRVDLLREVAEATDMNVIVAGDGEDKDVILNNQPDNLTYLGFIDESEKWRRFSEAKATLMLAENEDFGIVPIESMASGTPVIGANEGFTKHQIKNGKTGYTVEPTVNSVTNAIDRLRNNGVSYSEDEIADYATHFNRERFKQQMREQVTRVQNQSTVVPQFK